jgi:hypothetical protein
LLRTLRVQDLYDSGALHVCIGPNEE